MKNNFLIFIIFLLGFNNAIAQWRRIPLPTDISFIKDIKIVNDTIIYAVGVIDAARYSDRKSYLLKSKDLGNNWEMIRFPNNGLEINKIDFLNEQNGIATGNLFSSRSDIVLKTTNGGESWSIGWTTPDTLQTIVSDLKYVSESISVAIVRCYYEDYSLFLISNNGGIDYQPIMLNGLRLSNITIGLDSECYVSGYDKIFVTYDWGLSFETIPSPVDNEGDIFQYLLQFLIIDGNRIIVGGTKSLMDSSGPFLFQTLSDSILWEGKELNFRGSLNALAKDSIKNKYYLGYSTSTLDDNWIYKGFILSSDSEFDNFATTEIQDNNGTISDIIISDKMMIANIITGILFFDSTYVDVKEETVLNHFFLLQNYPNPFNPRTTIKYQIPGQTQNNNSYVQLKVYNILGEEIATLVNKEQSAGNYEVEFKADELTSGIYFYRIITDRFTETRKMVLMR